MHQFSQDTGKGSDSGIKTAIEINKPKEREDGRVFLSDEDTMLYYCLDVCGDNSDGIIGDCYLTGDLP